MLTHCQAVIILLLSLANILLKLSSHLILNLGILQSLSFFNPLSPTGACAQAMQTFSALDIAEKGEMAGGDLCHEHKQLISGLNGGDLYDLAIHMKENTFELARMV